MIKEMLEKYRTKIIRPLVGLLENKIKNLEIVAGKKLPTQYIALLEVTGGNCIGMFKAGGYMPIELASNDCEDIGGGINVFYGFTERYDDLIKLVDTYRGRIPKGYIPIAEYPGGDEICLCLKKRNYGKIYHWVHDYDPDSPYETKDMFLVADSIEDFLDRLYPAPEEDEAEQEDEDVKCTFRKGPLYYLIEDKLKEDGLDLF